MAAAPTGWRYGAGSLILVLVLAYPFYGDALRGWLAGRPDGNAVAGAWILDPERCTELVAGKYTYQGQPFTAAFVENLRRSFTGAVFQFTANACDLTLADGASRRRACTYDGYPPDLVIVAAGAAGPAWPIPLPFVLAITDRDHLLLKTPSAVMPLRRRP